MSKVPALNPLTFKNILDQQGVEASKRRSETVRFQVNVIRKLTPLFPHKPSVECFYDGRTEKPWEVVISGMGTMELRYLWAEPLKNITPGALLKRLPETSVYRRFLALRDNPNGFAGLIFPIPHNGEWIIHNLGWPEGSGAGYPRLIMQSRDNESEDLCVEPLEQFIKVRKEERR